eukprot:5077874-Alexandrium_andersonii.AAC.1
MTRSRRPALAAMIPSSRAWVTRARAVEAAVGQSRSRRRRVPPAPAAVGAPPSGARPDSSGAT